MTIARFHVRHDTTYDYAYPVSESHHLLRLTPRTLPWQTRLEHHIEIDPAPDLRRAFTDSFGNQITVVQYIRDHTYLNVNSECWVDLAPRPRPTAQVATQTWEAVRDILRYQAGRPLPADRLQATAFRFPSRNIPVGDSYRAYALPSFSPGRPLTEACRDLMLRIQNEFIFDNEATDTFTPVSEVLTQRRGVCQDFTHLMIACLRSLGLSARYTSGYLLTHPPKGQTRLVGADATHAWVGVFLPGFGWLEFDPTNGICPDQAHITLGWGRDFGDITPLRGVLLGGGEHKLDIAVTVVPEEEFAQVYVEGDTYLPVLPGL
ncbi:MAG: transglutaminase family protein [Marinobacter sp.]|nr:transglutaminase family protein [Marinobacter sp.]